MDYLSGKTGDTAQGKDVIILGGGDTGNDCVGTAIRQGATSITQVEMLPQVVGKPVIYDPLPQKAKEKKFDSSQEECLNRFLKDPHIYQATIKAVAADEQGNIQAVTLVHLEPQYDENRRLVMTEIPGSEETLPCGLLVIAAGFLVPRRRLPRPSVWNGMPGATSRPEPITRPAWIRSSPAATALHPDSPWWSRLW